jgi:hypothetical protein
MTTMMEVEMRIAQRHPILQRCFVRFSGPHGSDEWRGIAYNISSTGIGIALPQALPPGTLLEIEPCGLSGQAKVRASLVQIRLVEGLWFCGCELSQRLSATDLQAWRNGPADW